MSTRRKGTIEYVMLYPIYFALALVIAGGLHNFGIKNIVMGFFLCYFLVNMMISLITRIVADEKWDIVISFAISVLLTVMYRDKVLTVNIFAAFGVTLLIYILRREKIRRVGWALVTFVLILAWMLVTTNEPRYVGISLIALGLYSITLLLGKNIIFYMAVPVIIAVATLFTPVNKKPCQWTMIKSGINAVGEFFGRMSDEISYFFEGFGISGGGYSGYSETGEISGSVSDYDREEMKFTSTGGTRKTIIYLKGRSYLDLDSSGFTGLESELPDNSWLALYLNALYHGDIDVKEASFFSRIVTSNVEYKYLRTEDTIAPLTPLEVSKNETGKKKKGYKYSVRHIVIDYGSPYYTGLTETAGMPYEDYETIADYTRRIYKIELDSYMSEEQYDQALDEKDMSRYLDTDMATERIKELNYNITKDCENDYEKACRIEEFLRQYTYSKDVDLSDSENYIDDFLFNTQKGYCVHFASSMVLMLRVAGIPAKYSIGYRHNEEKSNIVTGSEAHAWPEAYIEGLGWVPFEPTMTYLDQRDLSWGLGKNYDPEKYAKQFEKKDEASESDASKDESEYHNEMEIPTSDNNNKDTDKAGAKAFKKLVIYIIIMLGALLVIILIILLVRTIRYRMMTTEQKLCEIMKRIYAILDKNGKEKTEEMLEPEVRDEYRALVISYQRVRFRGDEADMEMVASAKKTYRVMRKIKIKKKQKETEKSKNEKVEKSAKKIK